VVVALVSVVAVAVVAVAGVAVVAVAVVALAAVCTFARNPREWISQNWPMTSRQT